MKKIATIVASCFILCGSAAYANNTTYVLAARQINLNKTQDRIADMVANANTTGFKSEKDVYSEIDKRMADGKRLSYAGIKTTTRDVGQGSMAATGRQLDIAINGPGYFMVSTPRGFRYTRAGNFDVNPEGVLVTKEGYPVVGPGGGQVEFAPEDINITIRENGLVSVGEEDRGQLGVFIFADERLMVKEGNSLYNTSQQPVLTEDSKIVQGMLENSNVNSVTAMTSLVEVSRDIESVKQIQNDYNSLQSNAVRTLLKQ